MINIRTQKVLSGIIIATYLVFYSAPMGICLSSMPTVKGGVEAPVLRGGSQPSSVRLESEVVLSKKNPKISLSLRDSDVQQVLRMLADKAGLNIIFHSSVTSGSDNTNNSNNGNLPPPSPTPIQPLQTQQQQPQQQQQPAAASPSSDPNAAETTVSSKITLDLVNVPLNDAFRMITQVSGLTYYLDNNTIVVLAASASQKLNLTKQELMTIPVNYVNAGALAEFLNKNIFLKNKPGLTNSQVAVTNPNKNEILIFGTKNDYLMAKKIVAQLDTKSIEKSFTVNHTTPKEMATLICTSLFNYKAPKTEEATSTSTATSLSLGEVILACRDNNKINVDDSKNTTSTSGSGSSDDDDKNNDLYSLNNNGLSVVYNSQKGTVSILGGSIQQMEMIKDFIAQNDKKQPQAYLEISIIELNESGSKIFNNTWDVYSGFFRGTFATDGSISNSMPMAMSNYNDSALPFTRYTGPNTVTYTMNYILENTKGRVLANPKIVITNGQKSVIDLSSDYVKIITSQIITNTGSLTPSVQKTYTIGTDEGIRIEMTPFISPDGYVTMNIKPDYSTEKGPIEEYNDTTKKNERVGTLLQRRNLDLKNIRIKDGETFVIGGMMIETETKTIDKIPGLGDIPGLGMFFRNTSSKKEKQELVLLITPKIIKDTEDVVTNTNTNL